MSALAFWLTVLFGWVVISIVSGLVVGRILHRVLALPGRVPERRVRRSDRRRYHDIDKGNTKHGREIHYTYDGFERAKPGVGGQR